MKTFEYEINTGEKNMQIDSDLLDFAVTNRINEPIFRLYGWSPACVSIGRNQNDNFVNKTFLKLKNIDIVKRLTGGRALLHDNELTYCYICPVSILKNGESISSSYKEISRFLIKGFELLNIPINFTENKRPNSNYNYCMLISTGADLCYQGKKLIGSAQFRKNGYILQHGSINFSYNEELIKNIFNEEMDRKSIISLNEINPNLKIKDVIDALNTAFIN